MRGQSGNVRLKLAAEPAETVSVDLMYVKSTIDGPLDSLNWVTYDPELAVGFPLSAPRSSRPSRKNPTSTPRVIRTASLSWLG